MKHLLAIIAAFICTMGVLSAKTEYRFASGDCESGVGWWSTQRFDNGRLVETWGMDCNGKEYHTFGRTVPIDGPLSGSPTEIGACDAGTWFAVTTRSNGMQTGCWGQDCNGAFWQFEADAPSLTTRESRHFKDTPLQYEQVPMFFEFIRPGPPATAVDVDSIIH